MNAKETTLNELGEMLTHVVEHMATKEELGVFREDFDTFRGEFDEFRVETNQNFRDIRAEIADIRSDLDELREKVENITGYRKEIDHALERIAGIEKHLGIDQKVTA